MLIGIFVVMCLPFPILYIQNENKQFLNAFIVFLVIDIMIFFINIPDCNGILMEKRCLCSMRGKLFIQCGKLFIQYRTQKVNICYQDEYKYFFIVKKIRLAY